MNRTRTDAEALEKAVTENIGGVQGTSTDEDDTTGASGGHDRTVTNDDQTRQSGERT